MSNNKYPKDTIYVVQEDSYQDDFRVVYAGRSARKACEVASQHKSVRVSLHKPVKESV